MKITAIETLPVDRYLFVKVHTDAGISGLGESGAWGYLERLDQHRLYPPLEAMGVVVQAISTLLEADPQTSVREALGDLDEFREAVDCLDAYQQFQPAYFDRHEVNAQLHALVWAAEERP